VAVVVESVALVASTVGEHLHRLVGLVVAAVDTFADVLPAAVALVDSQNHVADGQVGNRDAAFALAAHNLGAFDPID